MMRYLGLVLMMVGLSACRFGNHADSITPPPTTFSTIDLITTQPVQFKTYVYYTDDTNTERTNVPLSQIPQTLLNNFSNPLYFAKYRADSETYMFVGLSQTDCINNPAQAICIDTLMDKNGNIRVDPFPYSYYFGSESCIMTVYRKQLGLLDKSDQTDFQFSDGSIVTSAGNLLLDYTYTREFQGDCTSILTTLASCYSDGTGCTSEELASSTLLFDVYVKSGALDIHDAPRIKSLEYIVHFR